MKNIFRICRRDFKKIFTNSMAIILTVGVALLPSLYAWFNIYANWDPYGSTGNMQVAVVNNDEGTEIKGIKIDIGDQIVTNLKANDLIDWQFLSKDEAVEGIKAGKYYAGIEIPSGFSESFTSIMTADFKQPEITYYANEKKNAIATKITDKVVQTVQTEVNESFVITVVGLINQMFGTVIEESDTLSNGMFGTVQEEITQAKGSIESLQSTLTSFENVMKLMNSLDSSLSEKDLASLLKNTDSAITNTEDVIRVTEAGIESISGTVDKTFADSASSLKNIAEAVKKTNGEVSESTQAIITQALANCKDTQTKITNLTNILKEFEDLLPDEAKLVAGIISSLENSNAKLSGVISDLEAMQNGSFSGRVDEVADNIISISGTMSSAGRDFKQNLQPKLKSTISALLGTMGDVSNVLTALQKDMPGVNTLVEALVKSAEAGDGMMKSLSSLIGTFSSQLDELSGKIEKLSNSDIVNATVNLTTKNADELGEFIACPVKVNTDKVYGIDNYGSAMAPFYTTLAIWVGATILVAILHTNIKKKKEFTSLKPTQEYFGRGLTFLALSLIQSVIICAGDLWFLRIQCYHPIKFMIAGITGSVAIMFFIYTLAYTFGDIGKALAVIMLVVQIGGSGGTFPIDVTPQFFRAINPYLPFTFVIEAMRECVCGTFENDFWIYLLKLGTYILVSLFIGLIIRPCVKKPIQFFTKRVEETGLF